jgi:ectoine hydroxylase-related dioxygenase (phytanoyl-CoA dioxygenase family)
MELTQAQVERFREDGFLILDRFLDEATVERARARFPDLFAGRFPTGIQPDEWNWREGRDPPDLTRQICNGWKADPLIASVVLAGEIGRMAARLMGWPGARIAQDNVIWKPPGAKPLGFHQDDSYGLWFEPAGYLTCWMALDDTAAAGGTIQYARGSHRWEVSPPIRRFHAPEDWLEDFRDAVRRAGQGEPELVPVEVPAGGAAFHHGRTWHGSDTNRADRPRRSLVSHCISSEARFHPEEVSYIYSRYRRAQDLAMDESFFPILWTERGYRTPWLDAKRAAA